MNTSKKECPICKNENSKFERTLNSIELLKCDNCDFVYANLSDEYIEELNSSYTEDSTSHYEENQTVLDKIWFKNIADRFTQKLEVGKKVLDVGCGNGILLNFFKQNGWDCVGVDLSPWSEKFAKKYNTRKNSCEQH